MAFAVTDIEATRAFCVEKLGCKVGRSVERWIDFDFFEHQISAHIVDGALSPTETNPVDDEKVPSLHFGAILDWDDWHAMKCRLEVDRTDFIISPTTSFAGEAGDRPQCSFATHEEMRLNLQHSGINR